MVSRSEVERQPAWSSRVGTVPERDLRPWLWHPLGTGVNKAPVRRGVGLPLSEAIERGIHKSGVLGRLDWPTFR